MKRRIFLLSLSLLFLFGEHLAAQNLRVINPQQPWQNIRGTIEEATFAVWPAGIYSEIEVYLTLSAQGWNDSSPGQQLEIQYRFSLPEGAIVHDSWLWVDSTIIKAKILDRWTASSIYEDIVDRRQDPSILLKDGPGLYRLQIYPLSPGQSRRVKFSYLAPGDWSAEEVLTSLPVSLLKDSRTPPRQTALRVWAGPEWGAPRLPGAPPDKSLAKSERPDLGNFWELTLSAADLNAFNNTLTLALDAPLRNGVFLNRLEGPDIYQLVLLPKVVLNLGPELRRKALILVDFNPANSSVINQADVLEAIRQQLIIRFSPADSFNVMLSGLTIRPFRDYWLASDEATINAVFSQLGGENLATYNQAPALLNAAVQFIQQTGGLGSILLFSNSGQEGEPSTANQLIQDLLKLMGDRPVPIHVADLQNRNLVGHSAGGQFYEGNDYLYINLTRFTTGTFVDIKQQAAGLPAVSRKVMEATIALPGRLDMYTKLADGFCFNRQLDGGGDWTDLARPVLQVGRYQGNFPFIVELAGSYQKKVFSAELTIPEAEVFEADTLSEEIWTGNYLLDLESAPRSNPVISEIVRYSLAERVLTLYTAFLCLEPSQGGEPCLNCQDRSADQATALDPIPGSDSLLQIKVFPNPFRDRATIELSVASSVDWRELDVAIYNMLGQPVRRFTPTLPASGPRSVQLVWDGRDPAGALAPGGVYLLVVRTPRRSYTHRLVFQR